MFFAVKIYREESYYFYNSSVPTEHAVQTKLLLLSHLQMDWRLLGRELWLCTGSHVSLPTAQKCDIWAAVIPSRLNYWGRYTTTQGEKGQIIGYAQVNRQKVVFSSGGVCWVIFLGLHLFIVCVWCFVLYPWNNTSILTFYYPMLDFDIVLLAYPSTNEMF